MKTRTLITREKFADRFPEGFDFNPERILSVSPFDLTDFKIKDRRPEVSMWRRIYASFLWMQGESMKDVAMKLNYLEHSSIVVAVKTVYKNTTGLFVDGTKNAIKSKAIKQALLDVCSCKDTCFILRTDSISDDELTALTILENNLQRLQKQHYDQEHHQNILYSISQNGNPAQGSNRL